MSTQEKIVSIAGAVAAAVALVTTLEQTANRDNVLTALADAQEKLTEIGPEIELLQTDRNNLEASYNSANEKATELLAQPSDATMRAVAKKIEDNIGDIKTINPNAMAALVVGAFQDAVR